MLVMYILILKHLILTIYRIILNAKTHNETLLRSTNNGLVQCYDISKVISPVAYHCNLLYWT